jgi:hypothetical protein
MYWVDLFLCVLKPEQVKVLMFDVIPGSSCHIKEMKLGMDPTPGNWTYVHFELS